MALAAAVALEHLAERALELGHERRAVLRRELDVAGDPERRQRRRTRRERGQVACHLLREVEQVAEPEQLLARPLRAEPTDDLRRDPERARHRAVDALGDAAHPVLGDELDELCRLQALDVVVHRLGRVSEDLADLRARARLGELPQDLDALGLEQRVRLLDGFDVERVKHLQLVLYVKHGCKSSRAWVRA